MNFTCSKRKTRNQDGLTSKYIHVNTYNTIHYRFYSVYNIMQCMCIMYMYMYVSICNAHLCSYLQ